MFDIPPMLAAPIGMLVGSALTYTFTRKRIATLTFQLAVLKKLCIKLVETKLEDLKKEGIHIVEKTEA